MLRGSSRNVSVAVRAVLTSTQGRAWPRPLDYFPMGRVSRLWADWPANSKAVGRIVNPQLLGLEFAKKGRDLTPASVILHAASAPSAPGAVVVAVARSGEDGDAAEVIASSDAENIRRRAAERAERARCW
jgi:hypothetical protein